MNLFEMSITGLKLITGDDIISYARFNKLERAWHLYHPGILVPMTNSSGNPSVGVADYIPFTITKEIVISDDKIIYTYEPDNEMITGYKSKFNDSEELPESENVLPFTRR